MEFRISDLVTAAVPGDQAAFLTDESTGGCTLSCCKPFVTKSENALEPQAGDDAAVLAELRRALEARLTAVS